MKTIWLMSATLFACGSNEAAVMQTTVTSAGMHVDVDHAVSLIADDRCNRQLSCGNIGKGHQWRDRRGCETSVEPKVRNVLGVSCSSIDGVRLQTCLNEIRDQKCAESIQMPLSCEGVQLCR